jgi:hypothetical protein
LEKFKNKIRSPKVKFMASMKLAFVCLKENERFQIKMPLCYHVNVVMNLSRLVSSHHYNVERRAKGNITIETVNAFRNKTAFKNAFMKFVVVDSLPWARNQIKEEKGQFGKNAFVVREYYEEMEIEEKKEENQIKEEKPNEEEAGKEENIKVKRIYLNPLKEEFVNQPIHKKHLQGKIM